MKDANADIIDHETIRGKNKKQSNDDSSHATTTTTTNNDNNDIIIASVSDKDAYYNYNYHYHYNNPNRDPCHHDHDHDHFWNISLLDLFDWEKKSIQTFGRDAPLSSEPICQPPSRTVTNNNNDNDNNNNNDIPKFCCLGRFSNPQKVCLGGPTAYETVRQQAIDLFSSEGYGYGYGYDDHTNDSSNENEQQACDICWILETLHNRNWTLSFWGDSVQNQVFHGFLCEASRRQYKIVEKVKVNEQRLMKNCTIPNKTKSAKYCLRSVVSYEVTTPEWNYNYNYDNDAYAYAYGVVRVHFFFQYQPHPDPTILYHETFEKMMEIDKNYYNDNNNQREVLLFWNFGLHYSHHSEREREQYALEMTSAMQVIKTAQTKNYLLPLVAFRQTSAQHFNTPGGEYQEGAPTYPCVPHDDRPKNNRVGSEHQHHHHHHNPGGGWREDIVRQVAQDSGIEVFDPVFRRRHQPSPTDKRLPNNMPSSSSSLSESDLLSSDASSSGASSSSSSPISMAMLNFFNFTAPLYDLHPNECSHNCPTPFLWYPLWRSLRLAIMQDNRQG